MEPESAAITAFISKFGYTVSVARDEWGDRKAVALETSSGYTFVGRGPTQRAALLDLAAQLNIEVKPTGSGSSAQPASARKPARKASAPAGKRKTPPKR